MRIILSPHYAMPGTDIASYAYHPMPTHGTDAASYAQDPAPTLPSVRCVPCLISTREPKSTPCTPETTALRCGPARNQNKSAACAETESVDPQRLFAVQQDQLNILTRT
eukprot:2126786-Rhodomonas_salina.3